VELHLNELPNPLLEQTFNSRSWNSGFAHRFSEATRGEFVRIPFLDGLLSGTAPC
jgi:hypothetical protein